MNNFNLTNYFGFECIDEGLNSPPEPTHHQNSPPLDSSNCYRSQAEVEGMKGSSLSLNKEKSKSKNCIDKGVEPTHHTQHQQSLNLGSYQSVDDDDPDWGPRPDP